MQPHAKLVGPEAIPAATREAAFGKYQTAGQAVVGLFHPIPAGCHGADRDRSRPLEGWMSGCWKLGHKTGSSGCRKNFCVATNDFSVLRPPTMAVLFSDSKDGTMTKVEVEGGVALLRSVRVTCRSANKLRGES